MAKNDIEMSNLLNEIETLESRVDQAIKDKEEAENQLARLQADTSASQELYSEAERRNVELLNKVNDLQSQLTTASTRLQELETQYGLKYDPKQIRLDRKLRESEIRDGVAKRTKQLEQARVELEARIRRIQTEAEERVKSVRAEMTGEVNRVLGDEDVYSHIFNEIIFPKMKYFSVLDGEKANEVSAFKLRKAINAAKKLDKKDDKAAAKFVKNPNANGFQRNAHSFNSIIAQSAVEADRYLNSLEQYEEGRRQVAKFRLDVQEELGNGVSDTEEIIERMLYNNAKIRDILLSKDAVLKVYTPVGLAALGLVAGVLVFNNLYKDADADYQNQVDVTKGTVSVTDTVESDYNSLKDNVDHAETVNLIYGENGLFSGEKNASKVYNDGITVNADENGIKVGYDKVTSAKEDAEKIISYNEDGTLNEDCAYAQALANYNKAVSNSNSNDVATYGDIINQYSNDMKTYYSNSNEGLKDMLDSAGTTMEGVDHILDILNSPTATIEFNDTLLSQYKKDFANPERGGSAVKVLSNEYVKGTGDVEILVECKDIYGERYLNLINYKVEKDQMVIDATEMLAPLKNNETVTMECFDYELETNLGNSTVQMSTSRGETISGGVNFKYSIKTEYDEKSDSTVVRGTAIVTLTNEDGSFAGYNTVHTGDIDFQGKVYAEDQGVAEAVEEKLADELNSILGTKVEVVSNAESEM